VELIPAPKAKEVSRVKQKKIVVQLAGFIGIPHAPTLGAEVFNRSLY
jgi:hypothetical protein